MIKLLNQIYTMIKELFIHLYRNILCGRFFILAATAETEIPCPPKKKHNKYFFFPPNSSGAEEQQGSDTFKYKTPSWMTHHTHKAFGNAPARPQSIVYEGVHKNRDPTNLRG